MRVTQYFLWMLTFIVGFNLITTAQEIATDNAGKPIFTIPSTNKFVWDIALNNFGLNYTPLIFQKTRYYVTTGAGEQNTMYKSTSLNIKGNILNNDEDVLLIGKDLDVKPHFEIGINRTIDNLINPSRINSYYTANASIFTDYQSFDLYDTAFKKFLNKYKRWSWGGKLSINIFKGTSSAWALNFSYKKAVVIDDLTSFQKISPEVYTDVNVATNGEVDGYIAPAKAVDNYRASIAHPLFLKKPSKLTLIPYYFIRFGNFKPKHDAGFLFTFLKNPFKNFDIDNSGTYISNATYEFETAFSIGLNLISVGTEKKNFIFLSGTVSFGKTKTSNITPDNKINNLF